MTSVFLFLKSTGYEGVVKPLCILEQRRTGGEGHAERLCTAAAAAGDGLLGGGVRGFHGRRNTNQTAGSD